MLMISSFVQSFVINVPTYVPSRITVTLSVITLISSIRWEIYTIAMSFFFKSLIILNISSISASVNAADGSSNTITFASKDTAFAISHICCLPTVKLDIISAGSISTFNLWKSFLDSSIILLSSILIPFLNSLPMNKFCATVK